MSPDANGSRVALRFFLPPPGLRPFLTTLYHMDVTDAPEMPIEDWLHPEWANLRLIPTPCIEAAIGTAPLARMPRAVLTGPTSMATRFRASGGRSWGIGILPLGWARLIDAPASDFADGFCDADKHPETRKLAGLCEPIAGTGQPDLVRERDDLLSRLETLFDSPAPQEDRIVAMEQALVDPQLHSVADLADVMRMEVRTLERFCRRYFGFPPQLLLRRQRFLRSLAQFMLDPSLKWIETLDGHYHDQAHFVRDFKRFMTMGPSEYARLPHPVLSAAAQARMAVAGEAMQVLHKPEAPQAS